MNHDELMKNRAEKIASLRESKVELATSVLSRSVVGKHGREEYLDDSDDERNSRM